MCYIVPKNVFIFIKTTSKWLKLCILVFVINTFFKIPENYLYVV